ncbi:MAG: hypothetical protein IKS03_03395 [Ruminococcus sp.]|jgi:hypothetical protein|nr:hypothetical protein [Ruminococcus sp.]
MLTDVLNSIKNELTDAGVTNVYTIFDAVPIEKKGRNFFTTVGVSSFETSAPIYTEFTVFIPFKAEIEIKVTARESGELAALYSYYDSNIEPVLNQLSNLSSRICRMSLKHDTNINRLVLNVGFSINGIRKIER